MRFSPRHDGGCKTALLLGVYAAAFVILAQFVESRRAWSFAGALPMGAPFADLHIFAPAPAMSQREGTPPRRHQPIAAHSRRFQELSNSQTTAGNRE